VRDYAVIVVQDCVETMDGAALHEAGLLCIKTAFGFVLDTAEIMSLGVFASADKSAA
jgi:biuret amidohydrolase